MTMLFPGECVRRVDSRVSLRIQVVPAECVGAVGFQASATSLFSGEIGDQIILRRLCATNWFSGDFGPPVDVGQFFCGQLVLTKVGASSLVSHSSVYNQLVLA